MKRPLLTITASNRDRLVIGSNQTTHFIKSIQWQTYDNFELLIADGGSKNYEELKEYLESYDGTIPMRIIQHKIGKAFLRAKLNNVGIRNALGAYIMTTDVDMYYGPKFVETLMNVVDPNVFVDSRTMYWKLQFAKKVYNGERDPYNIEDLKVGRIKKRTTAGGCQCTHKDNWAKVRGFDENYVGWGSEDQDLLKRISKACIRIEWLGESREEIMLFHQPHARNTITDLEYQEENKKLLNNITNYKVNLTEWGGIKD